MITSLRKRDSNPPNYTDLERNSIPQLQKILLELNVVPPSTSDRDELIQLIKLKTTPRKSQKRKMYQKAVIDNDSSAENNFSGNEDFNVSNDQYDDLPNDNIEDSQNNFELNGRDETAPYTESMLADDELSNSTFDAESSITTPQRPSSKLFPSKEQVPSIEDDYDHDTDTYDYDKQYSQAFSQSDSFGWGSSEPSSRSHSPTRRMRITPPKQIKTNVQKNEISPSKSHTNTHTHSYIHSNGKHFPKKKSSRRKKSKFALIKMLLFLFLLFLLIFFLLLTFIPLPGESKYLPHCPKHGNCVTKVENNTKRYNLYQCDQNYEKITNGLIQICAPLDSQNNEYKSTLEAAAYVSRAKGDCFFNYDKIDIEQIKKLYPQANPALLTNDEDFLTILEDNELKSLLPQYEPTCRAYTSCHNNQALTGLVIIIAFIASYVVVKRFSNYFS